MSEQQLNNLQHGDEAQVATVVAEHLHNFWARSMKQLIITYADNNLGGLSTIAQQAVAMLKSKSVG